MKLVRSRQLWTLSLSALVFFLVSLLFYRYFNILSVMGIRPSALPPTLGLMLGPIAVVGCAVGSFFADIATGHPVLIGVMGFATQLVYGILPYLMWNALNEIRGTPHDPVRLNSASHVTRYISIILINSAILTGFVSSIMHGLGVSSFSSNAAQMLLLNNIVFCIVLGLPIIVLFTAWKLRASRTSLSINERLVLIFLLTGIVSGGLIAVFVVTELTYAISDPVTMWMRIYMYIGINLIAFYAIAVVFLWYCERKITIPVESVAQIARDFISESNQRKDSSFVAFECDKHIGNRNEAGVLAKAFKTMVLDLDAYIMNLTKITMENERIATELNVARQLQADMLPNTFPAFPDRDEFEIYAVMQPAKEIGGDFYDFFMIDHDHLGVVIADVSGKGIPAALFMVITKTLISNWARNGGEPKDILTKVNSQLCEGNETAMFVTAWMGILKISTGELTCSNAGHDPPLYAKSGGGFEYVTANRNLMLAGIDGIEYKQTVIGMQSGDSLFLYTDGVTEANNSKGELYGMTRLRALLDCSSVIVPHDALERVRMDIEAFAEGEPQFDDITMLMLLIK